MKNTRIMTITELREYVLRWSNAESLQANGDAVIRGIQYAEQNGIDIINLSCSFPVEWYNRLVAEGINFSGIVTLCAQNHGCDIEQAPFMGGALEVPDNWIVVGNSNELDECHTSSNYSKLYVDLFAPGTDIYGLAKDGESYKPSTGTSMAAPHVAAATAILMSHATHLSVLEIRQLLLTCVDPIDDLEEKCVSGGRLSLINAVNELYNETRPSYSLGDATGDGKVDAKDYLQLKRIMLGTSDFLQIDSAADITLLSDSELKKYINAQLAYKRAEGEIIVFFEDQTEMQTAAEAFSSLGLPADLADKSVYLYCSAADDFLQFEKLWFKICVPESEIRDMMFALQRTSAVSSVSPNYIGSWA